MNYKKIIGWIIAGAIVGLAVYAVPLLIPEDSWRTIAFGAIAFAIAGGAIGYIAELVDHLKKTPVAGPCGDDSALSTIRTIAYAMLAAFCIALVLIYATAISDLKLTAWFELFKSDFLLLGGTVTTVVGYYFGNRSAEQTQKATTNVIEQVKDDIAKKTHLNGGEIETEGDGLNNDLEPSP